MFQSTHTITLTVPQLGNRRRKRVQEGYMIACFTPLTLSSSQYMTGKQKKEKGAGRVHDCMFHSTDTVTLSVHDWEIGEGKGRRKDT